MAQGVGRRRVLRIVSSSAGPASASPLREIAAVASLVVAATNGEKNLPLAREIDFDAATRGCSWSQATPTRLACRVARPAAAGAETMYRKGWWTSRENRASPASLRRCPDGLSLVEIYT